MPSPCSPLQDIDRKREELRTMVGERYRDLMEAAETIMRMRESADAVIRDAAGRQTDCRLDTIIV